MIIDSENKSAAFSPVPAKKWLDGFMDPPASYRLVPFWSWNEKMEPEEVKRQVRIIKQGGWGGAFVHSRIGLTTPYLGDDWFKAVDATLEACEEEGLLVWLYDEDKWPSGYSGGSVPLAQERFRAKSLIARKVGEPVPANCKAVCPPQNGLQVYEWIAPLGDPWFNGTSAVDRGSKDAMAKFIEDGYESYYTRYSQHYGKLIQAEFTDEPCMMFRIACPDGSVPHSENAFDRFEQMHGYHPFAELTKLFSDEPGAQRFRLHWHRTINDLFENNYSRQLGEWCSNHGIDLTGHYMCEHGVFSQQNWGVKIMPNYRHQQIPGIDHLGRQIDERITAKQCQSVVNQFGKKRMLSELYGVAGGGLSFEDRKWIALQQICLGVNLLNPHLSLYTMAGCRKRDFPQNIFYQQPWWELNHLVDDALARLCLSMSQGKYSASVLLLHPQESAQALWQTRFDRFDDDITGPYAGQDWNSLTSAGEEAVKVIEAQFFNCINRLLATQRSFDLGDEWILRDSGKLIHADGLPLLQVEQMNYQVVVIPSMETIMPQTFALLQKFQRDGGKVLIYGEPPRKLDGEPSAELSAWVDVQPVATDENFETALAALSAPSVQIEPDFIGDRSLLWTHRRDLEDGSRIVFFVNLNRTETFSGVAALERAWGSVMRLNEVSGLQQVVEPLSVGQATTRLSLNLAPCECRVFHMRAECVETVAKQPSSCCDLAVTQCLNLDFWSVERIDDNALTLDYAAWRLGDAAWSAGPVPVLEIQNCLNAKKYDGALSLRYTFRVGDLATRRKLQLVIEHPEHCRILLNGKEISYDGLPHWRDIRWLPIDITGQVQLAANEIVLEYTNFKHGDLTVVEPAADRYGTEIESIYIVGDFSVLGQSTGSAPLQPKFEQWNVPPVPVATLLRSGLELGEPAPLVKGDMTSQGLPFYAGRIAMRCEVAGVPDENGCVRLELEKLLAPVAEVQIDGRAVGHFQAHPLSVDISDALSDGKIHELTIIVYSTLRNLLGPHHHADGELIEVGPDHFYSHEMVAQSDRYGQLQQWAAGKFMPSDWRDDYCMVQFGDLGEIRLVFK